MILTSLVVKVAFIYTADRMTYIHGNKYAPTYRISMYVTPELSKPKFTVAISEVDKLGTIRKPFIVMKSR
jgi:hypothetical protein